MMQIPSSSRRRVGMLALLASGLALVACAGTSATLPPPQPLPGPPIPAAGQPRINPSPQHIVRVHGRMPARFDVDWRLIYEASNRLDEDCYQEGDWLDVPARQDVPLRLQRKGDRYEAWIVVDQYLPGKCQWRLGGTTSEVSRKDVPGKVAATEGQLINADRMNLTHPAPHCRADAPGCDEARARAYAALAASPAPAYVRCWSSGRSYWGCGDEFRREYYKMGFYLSQGMEDVEINFYDLDREPDPLGLLQLPVSSQGESDGISVAVCRDAWNACGGITVAAASLTETSDRRS